MAVKNNIYIKCFLLLLLLLCNINIFAQGQVVRRKKTIKPRVSVTKRNHMTRKGKKQVDRIYPYVRNYGSGGIWNRETSNHFWWLTSIELYPEYTVLNNVVMPTTANTYVYSVSSQYLLDIESGKKYYIKSSEIGLGKSNCKYFYDFKYKSFPFKEYYEPLPISTKWIRIYNGDRVSDVIWL